ncbi:MAG: LuxR C-terminal-related transcriptional regulator [Actinobacteria bacterium]|nr:LuxR C-terminal-related transcriptional regulator [Actinomycetota bacterium]
MDAVAPGHAAHRPRARSRPIQALGYSSRYVAERLQLSARTVETHLTHVYTKLGIDGREELRHWFSREREHLSRRSASS